MNKHILNVITVSICTAMSGVAFAQNLSENDYKAEKDKIVLQYKTAKSACDSLSGNRNEICAVEAKGKENIAIAELEFSYKPTKKNNFDASVVKAEAGYSLAKQRCSDFAGNTKDVCLKEAQAGRTIARADALVQLKTSNANDNANEVRSEANTEAVEARKDADADKLDAQYSVAKQKCDSYAGATKDRCLEQAKMNFVK